MLKWLREIQPSDFYAPFLGLVHHQLRFEKIVTWYYFMEEMEFRLHNKNSQRIGVLRMEVYSAPGQQSQPHAPLAKRVLPSSLWLLPASGV